MASIWICYSFHGTCINIWELEMVTIHQGSWRFGARLKAHSLMAILNNQSFSLKPGKALLVMAKTHGYPVHLQILAPKIFE